MALETAPYINALVPANPPGSDRIHQGDDHIRLIKQALKNTFPNLTGPVLANQAQLNTTTATSVPVGIVTAWWGTAADVPGGWAICNGQTVVRSDGTGNITTPNIQSRTIVGVDDSLSPGDTFGAASHAGLSTDAAGAHTHTGTSDTAGEHSHGGATGGTALSVDQMPAHNHGNGVSDNNIDNIMVYGTKGTPSGGGDVNSLNNHESLQGLTETVGGGAAHTHPINPGGGHSHAITMDGAGAHSHTLGAISTLQPSIALHYIMKI